MIKLLKKSESGQALVEFALILPILLTLLCGVIDFGWIYMNQYKVENAAYSGARYASLNASNYDQTAMSTLIKETKDRVKKNLYNDGKGATVNILIDASQSRVSVQVDCPVRCLTYVAQIFFGKSYNATSTSVASI